MEAVKILVVDDENVVLESCERALTSQGYNVSGAQSVDHALEKMDKEFFDIVIVDMVMPKKGGIELLRVIKQTRPQIQVIMITGYSSIDTAVESIKLGACDYLSKPFSPSELALSVKNALREKGRSVLPYLSDQDLPVQMIFDNIIGNNPKMIELFKLVSKVAATDTTVLIAGESGTGKELVARAIHNNSHRKDYNFVVVDCLSLSPNLLESELFGHTKGSFTGAYQEKAGFFEVASRGTLFLDEIGDLNFKLQGKLLRVIQERKYVPVGGVKPKETDIRLITATNKNLKKMVETGAFREDLFYRLYVVPIFIPPLRERKEDIPLLVDHFLKKFSEKHKRPELKACGRAMGCLLAYNWPGNIRELENTIERAVINCEGEEILPQDLPDSLRKESSEPLCRTPENIEELKVMKKQLMQKAVEDLEKEFLINALSGNDWNVSRAAKQVGMLRTNLYRLLKKHNIEIPRAVKDK